MNMQQQGDSVSRTLLREAALQRGLEVSYFGVNDYFMKLTSPDGRSETLRGTLSTRSSAIGNIVCRYKHLTIQAVQAMGFATPATLLYSDHATAEDFLRQYGQIVVKPADSEQSKGVTTDITDASALENAIEMARKYSKNGVILLQQQISGKLYRLFVLDGKLVAAAHRQAPQVIGDGTLTVQQLVDQLNTDPRRGTANDTPLKQINVAAAEAYLGAGSLQSIPDVGEIVRVSAIDSISAGGEAANVTADVHPDYIHVSEHIAHELQLFACGYDILCDDISAPMPEYFPLLEINSMPGLKLHHYPTAGGEAINLAGMFIDALFD